MYNKVCSEFIRGREILNDCNRQKLLIKVGIPHNLKQISCKA